MSDVNFQSIFLTEVNKQLQNVNKQKIKEMLWTIITCDYFIQKCCNNFIFVNWARQFFENWTKSFFWIPQEMWHIAYCTISSFLTHRVRTLSAYLWMDSCIHNWQMRTVFQLQSKYQKANVHFQLCANLQKMVASCIIQN